MKAIARIYKYIDYKGINNSKLEKEIGLSNGYLGKMFSRKADIGESSQGILVKRVRKHEKYPEYIILESDNREKYQPFDFPTSDIRSLSIVVGVIRLE